MAARDYRRTKAELIAELDSLRKYAARPAETRAADERDDLYRLLLKNLPDAVRITCEGNIVYANDAAATLFRAGSPEQLIGRPVDEFIPAHDWARQQDRRRMLLATGQAPREEQQRLRLDGSRVDVEVLSISVAWQGRPAQLDLIRDITDRVQARIALSESEARFHAMAENIPGATFQCVEGRDGHLRFTFLGRGVAGLFGVTAQIAMRHASTLFRAVHPGDRGRLRDAFRAGADGSAAIEEAFRTRKIAGVQCWVQVIARPRRRSDGSRAWDGLFLDVTEHYQALDALKKARDAAEFANRTKSEFLANLSHEVRNPLNAILGFADLIERETFGPVGVERYREYAEDIGESGRHLLSLLNDVLDISKVEAGRLELENDNLDIGQIIESSLSILKQRAQAGEIRLAVRIARSLPRLRGDARRIRQVLLNLLGNASKFTPPGGQVRVSATVDGGRGLRIRVSDTGIGMRPEDINLALTPFVQIGARGAQPTEGTGLGLPLAKSLVERHGGRLKLVSRPGKGTTVTVRFPPMRLVA